MRHPTLQLLTGFAFVFASCGQARSAPVAKEGGGGAVVLARQHSMRAVGTIATKESTMAMTDAILKMKAGEQQIEGAMSQTETKMETRETLAADKIRQLLVSKTTKMKMKLNGQEQNPPDKDDPMVGVPVILERKDGKWTASLESGGQPTAAQQASLDKEAASVEKDSDFAMFGDTPRKPGDKWEVDPAKLTNFGDAEDLAGKFQVEFVEVKELAGVRCAVLKSTFEIKGKSKSEGDSPAMDIQLKGEAVSQRSLADLIDLDVALNATMTLTGSPAPQMTMHVEGPMKMTEKVSLKKP